MSTTTARKLGRFELHRVLGRGAQASVWLAHDPRLDREVAVKLLDPATDQQAVSQWLHEARAVSRLNHPNVVPVFEADEQDGQPYLVFEYVAGPTLAEAQRSRGPRAATEAVGLMIGVLDALAAAHAQGIVHRDLKPSNVLLGQDGRARVMDFGIAARVGGGDGSIVGTPGYISPEAARGEPPAPSMDVFAAGVMLAELITGAPLLRERDPLRALQRVQTEDFALPQAAAVDDTLRSIIQRALSRSASSRYEGALALRNALAEWMQPAAAVSEATGGGHGTLEFLLRRMRHKSDFPALSSSVARIQTVTSSEKESLASLSAEILKDVALTNKLLRMVNTAHFSHAGGGSISTVSRAVALIGFAGIRNMAVSLVLLEHMRDKGHAAQLKDEFARSLMAGMLASELTPMARESEEAFLSSMFQNLGRLLTEYYFPEEALQIRQAATRSDAAGAAARDAAAVRTLGISLEELGVGVARSWGLPDGLQRAMRVPEGSPPSKALQPGVERQRWLGRAANELTDAALLPDPAERSKRLAAVAETYAGAIGVQAKDINEAVQAARGRMAELARAMGLQLGQGSAASRLLPTHAGIAPAAAASPAAAADKTLVMAAPSGRPPATEMLAAGIQDITNSMAADDFKLNEVLRMVLETIYRALEFRRVVFCLRDTKADTITGRFGLGDGADIVSRALRIPLGAAGQGDLFAAVCKKGVDTLISDTTAGGMAGRLPGWFSQAVDAKAFLLLPLTMKAAPFALIYADKAAPGSIDLGERELSMLRTLRNQAVMAFKQAG